MSNRYDNEAGHEAGYAKAIAETNKAILCTIGQDKFWIPKSVIHADSEVAKKGDEGELVVMEWWAESGHLEDPVEDEPEAVDSRMTRVERNKWR